MDATVDGYPFADPASSLPITDRAGLVGLCDDDVRAWSMAKADEYRRFALALLSVYNAVAPIHRLPFETLSKIFEECWTNRKSFRIGHVCRRWRSVLLNTPGFWASAVNGDRKLFGPNDHAIHYLAVAIERCAPRMVGPRIISFTTEMSRCIALCAARFSSLDVGLRYEELPALWGCLNSGMHFLNVLKIVIHDCHTERHRVPVWVPPPCLESLSVSPTNLPRLAKATVPAFLFPRLAVPSLQHLSLENGSAFHGRLASYQSFHEALSRCAHTTETLVLRQALSPLRSHGDRTMEALSLPKLQALHLQDTGRRCVTVLSALEFPDTAHIQVHCINGADPGILPGIQACPSVQPHISTMEHVEIVCNSHALSIHCHAGDSDRELIRVDLAMVGPHKCLWPLNLVWFFRDRPGARVTHLTVSDPDGRGIKGLNLSAFPHLVRVDIHGETASSVLPRLASEEDLDGVRDERVVRQVVCPELKMLAIDFHFASKTTSRGHRLGVALRNGDIAVLESDLRERCAELEKVLRQRSQKGGPNMTRLEFGCTEVGSSESSDARCRRTVDASGGGGVSWRSVVESLEELVEEAVVFTGYHYFSADEQ